MTKTDSVLVVDVEKEEMLLEGMQELVDAHSKILTAIMTSSRDSRVEDIINGRLNGYFPYHMCFNELFDEVLAWKQATELYLEGKSLDEINKEVRGDD